MFFFIFNLVLIVWSLKYLLKGWVPFLMPQFIFNFHYFLVKEVVSFYWMNFFFSLMIIFFMVLFLFFMFNSKINLNLGYFIMELLGFLLGLEFFLVGGSLVDMHESPWVNCYFYFFYFYFCINFFSVILCFLFYLGFKKFNLEFFSLSSFFFTFFISFFNNFLGYLFNFWSMGGGDFLFFKDYVFIFFIFLSLIFNLFYLFFPLWKNFYLKK